MTLKPETRDKLKTVSTATLSHRAVQARLAQPGIQDVHPLNPDQPTDGRRGVHPALHPGARGPQHARRVPGRSHPQREAIEDCPPGAVLVMDSRKDARAASAGAILVTRLMKRGVAGVVTDGGFRDSREIAELDFPAYHHRPTRADQSHAAPGDRHQRADRLRRRAGVSRRRHRGRQRRRDRDPCAPRRRDRGRGRRDDGLRGLRLRAGPGRLGIFGLYPATDPKSLERFAEWRKKNGR